MGRLAVVMVAFIGCTTTHPPVTKEPEPMAVPPLASSPAPTPSVSPALAVASAPAPLPRHPAGLMEPEPPSPPPPAIGAACTEQQWCGKSGKVAFVSTKWRDFRGAGDKAPPCKTVATSPRPGMYATAACVDGDRVYATSTCIMCRISSGEQMQGLVTDMTPVQLAKAQVTAGLPETPLLATPAAWSTAIAAAAKNAH